MDDQSGIALDPQLVGKILQGNQFVSPAMQQADAPAILRYLQGAESGVAPSQPLPPEMQQTGDPNPLVERMVADSPPFSPERAAKAGFSPQEIGVMQQADQQSRSTKPPRFVKELMLSPIRPILDAGQTLGGAMEHGTLPSARDAITGALDVGSMFMGPETLAKGAMAAAAKGAMFLGPIGAKNLARSGLIKGFDPELSLLRARHLDAGNVMPHDIWQQTGWWKGPDLQWKFEVPDNELKVTPGQGRGFDFPVKHEIMKGAYPGMQEGLGTKVEMGAPPGGWGGAYHSPSEKYPSGNISILSMNNLDHARGLMAHELQHAVQRKEGFSRGGSGFEEILPYVDDYFKNSSLPPDTNRQNLAYQLYRRTAGEVESNNVMKRLDYTPHERYSVSPPWETMEHPADEQIVRFLMQGGSQDAAKPWGLTELQKHEIAQRYAAGEKTKSIADAYGIVPQLVSRHATARGVPPRPSGPIPTPRPEQPPTVQPVAPAMTPYAGSEPKRDMGLAELNSSSSDILARALQMKLNRGLAK